MNELALFAGAGGGILGGKLLGWTTVCAVEWEPYPASVLCARQNDGVLPPFPIWDDIRTFDGKPWRGIVDVISGGFPCQDISAAGKGAGIDGERSGMWREMARVICEVRPQFVFVENSPMLTSRGLGQVLGDLASMGFDAKWGVLGAADVGAPHQRDRIWIVANSIRTQKHGIGGACEQRWNTVGWNQQATQQINRKTSSNGISRCSKSTLNVANTSEVGLSGEETKQGMEGGFRPSIGSVASGWWDREPESTPRTTQPGLGGVANGVAARVDRLKAIGNGQVPLCAATAWKLLTSS